MEKRLGAADLSFVPHQLLSLTEASFPQQDKTTNHRYLVYNVNAKNKLFPGDHFLSVFNR